MANIESAYYRFGELDRIGFGDTLLHRLDPATKLLVTAAFLVAVVSFPKYEIAGLIPFFAFPVFFMTVGDVPLRVLLGKLLIASPFALSVGIFNPLLDRTPELLFGAWVISGGWISLLSIAVKFLLTVSMAVLILATTSFPGVCHGLAHLRLPRLFVLQLMFLYRYIFVLVEEAIRLVRARNARGYTGRAAGIRIYGRMLASLFVRTAYRSERIHTAMLARGFSGKIPLLRLHRFGSKDVLFLLVSMLLVILFRFVPVTDRLGSFLLGGSP